MDAPAGMFSHHQGSAGYDEKGSQRGTVGAANSGSLPSPKITKLPEDLPPEVTSLIQRLRDFKGAQQWQEIEGMSSFFDDDGVYDTPFMLISGRQRIRAVAKLFSPLATESFEPTLVRFQMLPAERKSLVEVEGVIAVQPRRYWFLPLTYLLPQRIPVASTATVMVKNWNDKVARFSTRFHNLPSVPLPLRWLAGQGVGLVGQVVEPLALQLYEWFSAGYNTAQGTIESVTQSETVSSAAETVAPAADAVKRRAAQVAEGLGVGVPALSS